MLTLDELEASNGAKNSRVKELPCCTRPTEQWAGPSQLALPAHKIDPDAHLGATEADKWEGWKEWDENWGEYDHYGPSGDVRADYLRDHFGFIIPRGM